MVPIVDERPLFAFYSMEFGLRSDIPNYSGGLGVLAGDLMKSAADLGLNGVGVGNLYRRGYFTQQIAWGRQHEEYPTYDPKRDMSSPDAQVEIRIDGRDVKIRPWIYTINGKSQFPIVFLDTDIEGNHEDDRRLSGYLYGADRDYRIKQEVLLGMGGLRMLGELFDAPPRIHHINEGHGAFVGIELLLQGLTLEQVRSRVLFTTHTPVPAGHDEFAIELADKVFARSISKELRDQMYALSGGTSVHMTRLALNTSDYHNAVSRLHGDVTRKMYPEHRFNHITNGVHHGTWTSPAFQELYDKHLPGWRENPALLSSADTIPKNEMLAAHHRAKLDLIDEINKPERVAKTGMTFDPHKLTIGYARRYIDYKRAKLIFENMERLKNIGEGKLQLVFAGKAHPQYEMAKQIITDLHDTAEQLRGRIPVVFLEDYNMRLGQLLTSGCDVWLNTPEVGHEASGTSGMKSALNGVLHLSTVDGWWVEADRDGGWSFGDEHNNTRRDAHALYDLLEREVIPSYYDHNQQHWKRKMRIAICKNGAFFNTHRAMQQYADLYQQAVLSSIGVDKRQK